MYAVTFQDKYLAVNILNQKPLFSKTKEHAITCFGLTEKTTGISLAKEWGIGVVKLEDNYQNMGGDIAPHLDMDNPPKIFGAIAGIPMKDSWKQLEHESIVNQILNFANETSTTIPAGYVDLHSSIFAN